MSAYLYDEALVAKLKKWTASTQMQIYSPDETRRLFEVIGDTTNDEPIKLPILCIRRLGGYEILNTNKRPLTYDGLSLDSVEAETLQLNAIPIDISYQIDVYTRYYKEADAFTRDLVFNVINHPTLTIEIPYNSGKKSEVGRTEKITHNANLRLASTVSDNSDISERLITGQFTRLSLRVDLDDAYLWDSRIRNNLTIEADLDEDQFDE